MELTGYMWSEIEREARQVIAEEVQSSSLIATIFTRVLGRVGECNRSDPRTFDAGVLLGAGEVVCDNPEGSKDCVSQK
jgi:hypothetical protein